MNEKLSAFIISMAFNVYWLICVVFQGSAFPILLLILLAAIAFDRSVIRIAPIIALIGLGVDGLLTGFGAYIFSPEISDNNFIDRVSTSPLWLVFLWLGFSTYTWLMRSLLLKYSVFWVAILFSISGTTSYHAAARLGGVEFFDNVYITLMLLAIWYVYGFLFTYLVKLFSAKIFDNTQDTQSPSI